MLDSYHRVRTLIPFLNYTDLVKRNIIPKEKMFTNKTVISLGGKTICPKLAKKLGPSQYGLLMEEIIESLLENNCNVSCLNFLDKYKNLNNNSEWIPLAELLKNEFIDKKIVLQPQAEINDDINLITGHPDLISNTTVYDIKTTGQFGKMRTDTILQLLSYYCLCKINLSIDYIGLILPLQLKVIIYNLKDWKWEPFYDELKLCISKKYTKLDNKVLHIKDYVHFNLMLNIYVGSTVKKDQLFDYHYGKPIQFFINGNQTSRVSYTTKYENDMKKFINNTVSPVFIHAPYILNFSFPGQGKKREEDQEIEKILGKDAWGGWTFYCLYKLLIFGKKTGINGIVIHCGKTCGGNYKEAVKNMKKSIIICSKWATKNCKILIETSAGQNGEILSDPNEFIQFYQNLPNHVKEVVGICVDTCHVFSAGYEPMVFIDLINKSNILISLIHYNDSKGELGCKKDRHAIIGHGYIPIKQSYNVLLFAMNNAIPMVTE